MEKKKWLEWARELQVLAQAGLAYCGNDYDRDRYERIREIASEIIATYAELPIETVRGMFYTEKGYPTPKLDTRAAIFENDKILLVRELTGKWSLPGGWVDADISVKENAIKEVREEAGLTVTADLVIAVQDRELHNQPLYAQKVCKIFVLCTKTGGAFAKNTETTESGYFGLEELPPLAEEKVNREQLQMCFDAFHAEHWKTVLE